MNLIILVNTWYCLSSCLFSPDLPASSLQYQCGSVDYLCSPRLVKKGPTPRPCHDRPAIKPRPQPSTSPRPPTAQKPQGNRHGVAPFQGQIWHWGCHYNWKVQRDQTPAIELSFILLWQTLFYNMVRVSCPTSLCHSHISLGHLGNSCWCKAGQGIPSVDVWASFEEC